MCSRTKTVEMTADLKTHSFTLRTRSYSVSGELNPVDLGYLVVYAAQASLAGTLKDNATQAKIPAGRLGTRDAVESLEDITAKGPLTLKNVIVLGNPLRFTKDNIDQFNF
jgi:hypothetical protein